MDLLISGGVVLVAIFALSVYAVYLFFVRLFKLSRERLDVEELMVRVNAAVRDRDLDLALEACEQHGGPVARVLQSALLRLPYGRQAVEAAFAEASLLEEQSLTRGLRPLATIAQVAPLLGLLGTVTGMIIAFGEISASGTGNPGLLAGGIGQALVTTAAGLIVAIPVLIGQNYLASRVDAILTEIDRRREELMANVVQAVAARKEPPAPGFVDDASASAQPSRAGAVRARPAAVSPRVVPAGLRPVAVPAAAAAGGSASLFAGDASDAGDRVDASTARVGGDPSAADGEDAPAVGRGGRLRVQRLAADDDPHGDGRSRTEAVADGDEPPDPGR